MENLSRLASAGSRRHGKLFACMATNSLLASEKSVWGGRARPVLPEAVVSHSCLNLKSNLVLGNPGWRPRKSSEIQYFGGKSSVVHLKEKRPHTATEPLSFPRQPNAIWFPFRVPNPINQTLATDFSGTDTANKY